MERRQVLSCNSLTECSKGELFHGFYFFLSMVLSLLISVMTLVLSSFLFLFVCVLSLVLSEYGKESEYGKASGPVM